MDFIANLLCRFARKFSPDGRFGKASRPSIVRRCRSGKTDFAKLSIDFLIDFFSLCLSNPSVPSNFRIFAKSVRIRARGDAFNRTHHEQVMSASRGDLNFAFHMLLTVNLGEVIITLGRNEARLVGDRLQGCFSA